MILPFCMTDVLSGPKYLLCIQDAENTTKYAQDVKHRTF